MALVLIVLGGCAQVLGLEEWKQADCEDVADDPADCEEPVTCSECLFGAQASCLQAQTACTSDATTGCGAIFDCSQMCAGNPTPMDCIRTCCGPGNGLFDAYLECQCGICGEACGTVVMDCADSCNEPPPPPP